MSKRSISWSSYQEAIFSSILESDRNIQVKAVAGSGKSSTSFEAIRRIRESGYDKPVSFLSFNKYIQSHAELKLKGLNVDVRTFHGAGFGYVRQASRGMSRLKERKLNFLINKKLGPLDTREYFNYFNCLSFLRNWFYRGNYDAESVSSWMNENLSRYYTDRSLNLDWLTERSSEISSILKLCDCDLRSVDFTDMVRLPAIHSMIRSTTGLVFVDESQDIDPYQLSIIKQLVGSTGRLISLGDPDQAIYGFRGARLEVMEDIREHFNCEILDLPVTYRVPSAAVEFVRSEIEDISMISDNDGGKVFNVSFKSIRSDRKPLATLVSRYNPGTVIAATNRSLINLWFDLAEIDVASTLKDTGIVITLRNEFESQLSEIREGGVENPTLDDLKYHLDSRIEVLKKQPYFYVRVELELRLLCREIADRHSDLLEVFLSLERLKNSDTGMILNTVHSSKGLEYTKVLVIQDWFDSEQSSNMRYVAYTRVISEMMVVNLDGSTMVPEFPDELTILGFPDGSIKTHNPELSYLDSSVTEIEKALAYIREIDNKLARDEEVKGTSD